MTERKGPDDRELEQYLKGESPLSRRYREASAETAPPELDEAILARARAELRRKPAGLNRWLAPVALAASVVLGVNLAWNVYEAQPVPLERPASPASGAAESRDEGFVPSPPPVASAPAASAPEVMAEAPVAPAEPAARAERKPRAPAPALNEQLASEAGRGGDLAAVQQREQDSLRKKAESEERMAMAPQEAPQGTLRERQASAGAPAGAATPAMADAAPMSEAAKIDRLINYIGNLAGATFIRNGKDYGATEAAKHLQLKREKAGDRVRTAEDFIRLCASHSYLSGEAYLVRFADGRTRTAEDVLREELARLR